MSVNPSDTTVSLLTNIPCVNAISYECLQNSVKSPYLFPFLKNYQSQWLTIFLNEHQLLFFTGTKHTFLPVSVLKQYEQPFEQKELALQVMSNASRTVPEGGEMLHEGGLGSAGASSSGGFVGSA